MIEKKSKKADIDRLRGTFFRAGLLIALALCILAFRWRYQEKLFLDFDAGLQDTEAEEMIEITRQNIGPDIPTVPELKIVENKKTIKEEKPVVENPEKKEEDSKTNPASTTDAGSGGGDNDAIMVVVQNIPVFPGGDMARVNFLRYNINYPKEEKEKGLQGLVIISFVVEKDGSLTNLKVVKGNTPAMNEEALRVARLMPRWNPGKQDGKPVRVVVNLPIRFSLK